MASNTNEASSSLSLNKDKLGQRTKAKEQVADSWEDEDEDDEDDVSETEQPTAPKAATPAETASVAHPSTPFFGPPDVWSGREDSRSATRDERRPEKTDAVARRLIVAGLGLKAPPQTDEQRAYQKSVREQEKKRRDEGRSEQQQKADASERAKASVWED